ncbi:MAG: hypothetical protein R3F53_11535 [Gammaproteobacteria bacterium]
MKNYFLGFFLFFCISFKADACSISIPDLTDALQAVTGSKAVISVDLTDQYSEEPIKRYVQTYDDGLVIILEQKYCLMYNLSLTLFLPESYPIEKAQHFLTETLEVTDLWKNSFTTLDAEAIFSSEFSSDRFLSKRIQSSQFSYPMDDAIKTEDENSEVILSFVNFESYTMPYKNILSLYIGVGGL